MANKVEYIKLPEGTKVPNHVAIVMDGNRRWARARGLDTLEGHKNGFNRAIVIGRAARAMGIHTVSLWGFSTENWDREPRELSYLMMLYKSMLAKYLKEAMTDEVRLVHLGRKDRLPKDLIEQLADAEEKTKHFTKYLVNICLDSGGRDEIVRAVQKIIKSGVPADEITEKSFANYLDTADQPYPYVDLFIRTSGEQRTSGFMLWQAAYAETYWEIDHLPDFSPEKLRDAVLDYSCRRRRFGANDKEEHLKFKPEAVAKLELDWKRELPLGESKKFSELVIKYVKEQYGLSKDLAKTAGYSLAKALVYREQEDWVSAKTALKGLYEVVKKNLNLAMEPELVANIEVDLWKDPTEQKMRKLYSETYRVSEFQATKVAHLGMLADEEMKNKNWEKAKVYSEMRYKALKERVA